MKEWRTVIIGFPIISKLIHGKSVELETFKIILIPDDQLFNEDSKIRSEELSGKKKKDSPHEMREIKFRQWLSSRKRMHYGIGIIKDGHFAGPPSVTFSLSPLMQFTGLLDRNGKEIWEGNIVSAQIYADEDPQCLEVKYVGSGFVIDYEDSEADYFLLSEFPGTIEVIGDIYSNPDLLKKE